MIRTNFDNAMTLLCDHVTENYLRTEKVDLQESVSLLDAMRVVKRGAIPFDDSQLAMIVNATHSMSEIAASSAAKTKIKGMQNNFEAVADSYNVIACRALNMQK